MLRVHLVHVIGIKLVTIFTISLNMVQMVTSFMPITICTMLRLMVKMVIGIKLVTICTMLRLMVHCNISMFYQGFHGVAIIGVVGNTYTGANEKLVTIDAERGL